MRGQDFLEEDYEKALKEHECIWYCTDRVRESLKSGDIHEVHLLTKDMEKSAVTIQQMQLRKKEMDQLHVLIAKLQSLGIHAEVIQKKLGGW